MRIIAFITAPVTVRNILTHLGEPTAPPRPTRSTSASPGSRIVDSHPRATPGGLAPAATLREPRARRRTWVTRPLGKNGPTATPNCSLSPSARLRLPLIT